ncbi:MAG: ATP-binding cassette domain-containing protein, partial [Lachnospiraceae bacterium]|nr:ATP-binding cassette domain-containing protein [Lachnospiraceae bacterium]
MLEISHISKTFNPGTINEKKAIRDLSLIVKDGDFITMIGSNGAGKSTLFNAIAGSFITDSGSIKLDGEDITLMPEHIRARRIGRLFQDPMLGTAPGMSIEENLALAAGHGGWLSSVSKKEKNDFREKLALLGMGLEDRMKQPVGLLSGGQRQALTLMMATYNPPRILLLDEHTAALDPA